MKESIKSIKEKIKNEVYIYDVMANLETEKVKEHIKNPANIKCIILLDTGNKSFAALDLYSNQILTAISHLDSSFDNYEINVNLPSKDTPISHILVALTGGII